MKVAYKWLSRYIDTSLSPREIAEILTKIGLEVEGVQHYSSITGGLAGLVVAEVLTCVKHPNADRLSVTTVNAGGLETLSVVCGAPNVAVGQKVVLAPVGVTLHPTSGEPFTIKKSKIRGEVSEGMLCAADEIGLSDEHEGILVLPHDTPVGRSVAEVLDLFTDEVFEIGLTANRADAMSHYGVARDLSAYLYQTTESRATLPEVVLPVLKSSQSALTLGHCDANGVIRYSGLTIRNISVKPSPEWLQNALKSIGLHPINNVVDITNFVLHELGQPLHAFDLKAFTTGSVSVHTLPEGTLFTTLDNKERKLSAQDVMICDGSTPLCLAGIFGGIQSGVTEKTTDLFLESAVFNPQSIRQSARRHGLNTDASFRFERGVDPTLTIYALERAASLVLELAGGTIDGTVLDFYPAPYSYHTVRFSLAAARQLMGMDMPEAEILRLFDGLEILYTPAAEGEYTLQVPRFRVDVTRQEDVVEEILRLYGFDRVPMPSQISFTPPTMSECPKPAMRATLSRLLVGIGFQEIMSLSLTADAYFKNLTAFPSDARVYLTNPLSADLNVLRPSLLMGGLDAVARNHARQRPDLMFFEIGNVFAKQQAADLTQLSSYRESTRLSLWLTGAANPELWNQPQRLHDIFSLREYLEAILREVGIEPQHLTFGPAPEGFYQEGSSLMLKRRTYAHFGCVSQQIAQRFSIKAPVYYAELDFDALLAHWMSQKAGYVPLPRFPEVRRDLALLLDKSVQFVDLQATAFRTEPKLLQSVQLFDVYEGEKIGKGKKSYALSFILQDAERTLTDRTIDGVMERLLNAFVKGFGAELR